MSDIRSVGVSSRQSLGAETLLPNPSALAVLDGMKRKIGMIRLWPEQAAAEHESIERYRFACSLLGVEVVELDRLGFLLNGPRRRVTQDDVDFVISLHFETPKSYDCFSWAALWNPVDFYVDWGFDDFVDHQFTHDGYLTCGSRPIERLAQTELGERYARAPKVNVNHTLSGPIYRAKQRDDRRLVYCGINWERLSNKPGRFDHLLQPLDDAGVLDVFGPSLVQNVRVWEGFSGYKREVPFDGTSLIGEIAQSGAVLALSSNAHLRSGVMTSRLFEGAAAGALVFADANSFVARYFSDETVPIELTGRAQQDSDKIIDALKYYNNNPHEGYKKSKSLQDKYIDGYMLHNQLLDVYREYIDYQGRKGDIVCARDEHIGYVILWPDQNLPFPTKLIDSIERQTAGNAFIRIVTIKNGREKKICLAPQSVKTDIKVIQFEDAHDKPNAFGSFVLDAIETMPPSVKYVSLLTSGAELFSEFAANMVSAASKSPVGSVSAQLNRHYDPADHHFTGLEFIALWRPRANQPKRCVSIDSVLLKRDWLMAKAGAIQMMSYTGLTELVHGAAEELEICDKPLIWFDLKQFERESRLVDSPYPNDNVFLKRYSKRDEEAIPFSASPKGNGDAAAFLARYTTRKTATFGIYSKLRNRIMLARARRAARAKDWAAAEGAYAALLSQDGGQAAWWMQFGHALKEQGEVQAARFSYSMALELSPDNSDTQQHFANLEALG